MALRATMSKNLRGMLQQLQHRREVTTGAPKMKSTGATIGGNEDIHHFKMTRREPSLVEQLFPKGKPVGDYFPIYVALGMISLSVSLGLVSAKHQLLHAPDVRVRKSRREMLPEVVEPEQVARESSEYKNKSFFRKVVHLLQLESPIPASFPPGSLPREPRVESLKTVGVEPVLDSGLHRR